jgi:hypothetical protein
MTDKKLVPFIFEAKVVVPFEKEEKLLAPCHLITSFSRCSRLVVRVRRHCLKKAGRQCTLSHMIAVVKQLRRSLSVFLATWI